MRHLILLQIKYLLTHLNWRSDSTMEYNIYLNYVRNKILTLMYCFLNDAKRIQINANDFLNLNSNPNAYFVGPITYTPIPKNLPACKPHTMWNSNAITQEIAEAVWLEKIQHDKWDKNFISVCFQCKTQSSKSVDNKCL